MRLILGSSSPRRKEILNYFSYPFKQVSHPFMEDEVIFKGDPSLYAIEIAKAKAEALAATYPNEIILTADTTVFHEGGILNKPKTEQEGFEMLKKLNGNCHSVFTAVVARCDDKAFVDCEETRIYFRKVSEEKLKLYHAAFNGLDKAGGYGIQMGGSVIVERIEGCFYNVMGMPLGALQKVLSKMGIDIWHYLLTS